MASLRRARLLATVLLAAATAATVAACNAGSLLSLGPDIKKLYIKDYTLNVDARLIAGTSSKDFEDAKILNVRSLGAVGVVYSPNYVFVAEPTLLIAATSPIALPSDQTVEEPQGFDATGALVTETVLRKPLYIINKLTLTYAVPGYTIAPVTITEDIPIKNNAYTMKLAGVAQVNELMAAFASNPATVPSVAGSVTLTLDITDADPLSSAKTFTVARSLPLVYSYLPFRPETDIATQGGGAAGGADNGGGTGNQTPATAAPTVEPTATPSPTPLPTNPPVGAVSTYKQ